VMETDLSLRAPRADDRTPRPKGPAGRSGSVHPARKPKPKHHASDVHGKAHAKQGHAPSRAREEQGRTDRGDRRDRKGNDVWSNAGPPRRLKRKPATRV